MDNELTVYVDVDFISDCIIWFGTLPKKTVTINGYVYDQVLDYEDRHYGEIPRWCISDNAN